MTEELTVRECTSLEDFDACVRMQRDVWQFAEVDILPLRSFVVTRRSGGATIGAFDGNGQMQGFAYMVAAFDEHHRPYFYSQMAAVNHGRQNAGIGRLLKLGQRDYALQRGIALIVWTFDPLQSRNAYFNLVKLGAVVRTYYPNYYGQTSSSVLHRGLDSDRLFAEWWVGSTHVAEALAGSLRRGEPQATVDVPVDIDAIKASDIHEARRWQTQIRDAFLRHLAGGLYCAGFERTPDGASGRYLFYPDEQQEIPTNR